MRCLVWTGYFMICAAIVVIVSGTLGFIPALLCCVGLYFMFRETRRI